MTRRLVVAPHRMVPTVPKRNGDEMLQVSEAIRSRIKKFDGVVILDLDMPNLENEVIDAAGIDHIAISGARALRVTIRNLNGTMTVSGAPQPTICTQLRVERCNVKRLSSSAAEFLNCAFVETVIHELLGAGATFSHCSFSGSVKKGIFFPKAKGARTSRDSSDFEENDFTKCELGDVSFRGGVNLKKQRFSSEQTKLIIERAPALLELLDRELEEDQTSDGVRKLRNFVRRSVVDFGQQQIFVSKPIAREFLCKYLADFEKERDALSPEFAEWARVIRRYC